MTMDVLYILLVICITRTSCSLIQDILATHRKFNDYTDIRFSATPEVTDRHGTEDLYNDAINDLLPDVAYPQYRHREYPSLILKTLVAGLEDVPKYSKSSKRSGDDVEEKRQYAGITAFDRLINAASVLDRLPEGRQGGSSGFHAWGGR